MLPFVFFIILGVPLPLSSLLVLSVDLGTELGPSMAYVHDPAEKNIMMVPPRKVLTSQLKAQISQGLQEEKRIFWIKIKSWFRREETGQVLVDNDSLIWCYLEGGIIETAGCFAAYLIVFVWEGVPLQLLYRSSRKYFLAGAPDIILNSGKMATASDQILILGKAQAAFYLGIVICQTFNVFVCKHLYEYPYGMDMLRNPYTVLGVFFGLGIAAIIVYVPWINTVLFSAGPCPPIALLPPIGAGILLFLFEFVRRFLRKQGIK